MVAKKETTTREKRMLISYRFGRYERLPHELGSKNGYATIKAVIINERREDDYAVQESRARKRRGRSGAHL